MGGSDALIRPAVGAREKHRPFAGAHDTRDVGGLTVRGPVKFRAGHKREPASGCPPSLSQRRLSSNASSPSAGKRAVDPMRICEIAETAPPPREAVEIAAAHAIVRESNLRCRHVRQGVERHLAARNSITFPRVSKTVRLSCDQIHEAGACRSLCQDASFIDYHRFSIRARHFHRTAEHGHQHGPAHDFHHAGQVTPPGFVAFARTATTRSGVFTTNLVTSGLNFSIE